MKMFIPEMTFKGYSRLTDYSTIQQATFHFLLMDCRNHVSIV